MNKNNLTPLQAQYIADCEFLQAIGYPDDLFDGLYLEYAKSKK